MYVFMILIILKQVIRIHSAPQYWPFENIKYTVQSPINIQLSDVTYVDLPPLIFLVYPNINQHIMEIENNGYTVEIHTIKDDYQKPYLTGGPLMGDVYLFENMHVHWGQRDYEGSENRLDGYSYSCEVHMVYYNSLFGSFEQAKDKVNGLTVLAFFGVAGDEDNLTMEGFIYDLKYIQEPGSKIYKDFGRVFSWIEEIISYEDWISYPGSLTTPPYSESVTWIVMTTPFTLSHRQLNQFRNLCTREHKKIIQNQRPLQNPNRRPVIRMKHYDWPSVIVDPYFAIR